MSFIYQFEYLTAYIKDQFAGCSDFVVRDIEINNEYIAIMYIDNLCDRLFVSNNVVKPFIELYGQRQNTQLENILTNAKLVYATSEDEIINMILAGAAFICRSNDTDNKLGVIAFVRNEASRSISEPETETVIRGPREGFVESAAFNASLIRRRIKSVDLKYESLSIGTKSKTNIIIMYLSEIADKDTLDELKKRLGDIEIDAILDSGYIEQYIQDGKVPLYPTVGNSERPDKVAAKILEGRIAILCDGTPVVLTVPYLFIEAIQSSEDYTKSPYYATFIRMLRFSAMLLSIYLPALFTAIMYFHQTVVPFKLLLTIGAARADIPFSVFIETLTILIAFEIIREVGLRMPRSVGDAVSIVGAIVLGDSAISAGIASAPVIIVVAITAISNFITPPYIHVNILVRFIMLIAARILGLYGIGILTLFIILHLSSKRSFGTPYFSPFAPITGTGLLDFILMVPIWGMKKVPPSISAKNITRAKSKKI